LIQELLWHCVGGSPGKRSQDPFPIINHIKTPIMKMYNFVLGAGILLFAASENTMANSKLSIAISDTIITPPANISASFNTRYPKATNVKWYQYNSTTVPIEWDLTGWPALSNKDYTVMYEMDNANYYAWYDAKGNWIGSTNQLKDFAGLPAPVSKMLSAKYAGYTISDVHAESYKDLSAYELELKKGNEKVKMVVDPNGNVLKQKTKKIDADGNEVKEKVKIEQ
jgi:hypothetical protein